jgi:cytochrome c biogenesis protein CcmG, thiol:disulfide interchange protein DsbE
MGRRPRTGTALLAALCLLACTAVQAMRPGEVAPELARAAIAGKPFALSSLRGHVVLLNFWATWCAPCREEMPVFSEWQRRYGPRGLRVVGVSMDDDVAEVRQVLAKRPVAYPVVMGDAALAEGFGGVLGLPLSYLLDAEGKVVARYQGEASLPVIERQITAMLGRPAGTKPAARPLQEGRSP